MSDQLKQARIKAGLSVQDVSNALSIRKHYIIALEENRFDEIPSKVYVKGYMQLYAKFLNIEYIEPEAEIVHKERNYTKVLETFGRKSRAGFSIAAIFLLIVAIWIYMAYILSSGKKTVMENLENTDPTNHMMNITDPQRAAKAIEKQNANIVNDGTNEFSE